MANILKWAGLAILALVLAVIGVQAFGWVGAQFEWRAFRAAATEDAAGFDVRIVRDEFGVPHIYGETDPDTAFGLAYAHAEDDWETIQTTLLAARGQLARYAGADAAPTDYVVQLLRIGETVETRYRTDLSEEARAVVEAYAAGLNLYAAENKSQVWTSAMPVTGQDVIAGFVLRTPFMYGLDADIAELFEPERQRSVSLGDADTAFQLVDEARLPLGSNALAVAPSRSSDGATRLLINSHQPFEGPVAWYEARLQSGEGWDIAGGTFPGAPLILHGHNRDLGWAHTVNLPDLADVYVLETEGDRYRFGDEWRDLEHGVARLDVRIWGPIRWTVSRDLWWSEHGPVVRTDHGDYALRYSGMEEIRQVEQWYAMNRARNWEEWRSAMEMNAIASLNAVYADREGHIAYLYNARMPVRETGYEWRDYLPGDRPELVWQDFHAFDSLPLYLDPEAGWLLSANQTPFDATDVEDNLDPASVPAEFGIEPRMTNRAYRGLPLLRELDQISREDVLRIKFDKAYAEDSAVGRLIDELLAMDFSGNDRLSDAQALLGAWDRNTDTGNRNAAIGVLTAVRCIGNRHTDDPWLMDPAEALAAAADELILHHGRLDPEWGEINRMIRGDVDLPLGGGPDTLRAIYGAGDGLDEDGRIRAVAGDTYIMLVEWDAGGEMRSSSIHQYGSATMDSSSPHFADQAPLFAREEWREMDFSIREGGYRPGR